MCEKHIMSRADRPVLESFRSWSSHSISLKIFWVVRDPLIWLEVCFKISLDCEWNVFIEGQILKVRPLNIIVHISLNIVLQTTVHLEIVNSQTKLVKVFKFRSDSSQSVFLNFQKLLINYNLVWTYCRLLKRIFPSVLIRLRSLMATVRLWHFLVWLTLLYVFKNIFKIYFFAVHYYLLIFLFLNSIIIWTF